MKSKFLMIFSLYLFSVIIISCSFEKSVPQNFSAAIEKIQQEYAPDKRVALFTVDYSFKNSKLHIAVETNIQEAIEDVRSVTENLLEKDSYNLQISKLPADYLNDSTYALVNVSVANLRRHPKHAAELIDQSIMGTTLKILKKKGFWYLVQTPYDYLGWTGGASFIRISQKEVNQWNESKKIKVKTNYAQVFQDKNKNSFAICDAVYGSEFKFEKSTGSWFQVALPDGNKGFIEKKYCDIISNNSNQKSIQYEQLLTKAKSFLGIPYLWGGNSSKGFDCSGFSQTVFKSQNIFLPRDANMQVNLGEDIKPLEDFSNVEKGDLIFFGPNENRITHVAISLGGPDFIHSSGNVHINSFDKEKENFNQYRFETLRYIKRIVK